MFVYLVACPVAVKIGIAVNTSTRLSSLQNGNPYKLELIYQIQTKDKLTALGIERYFKNFYKDIRLTGEWFAVDSQDAISCLENLMSNNQHELKRFMYAAQNFNFRKTLTQEEKDFLSAENKRLRLQKSENKKKQVIALLLPLFIELSSQFGFMPGQRMTETMMRKKYGIKIGAGLFRIAYKEAIEIFNQQNK